VQEVIIENIPGALGLRQHSSDSTEVMVRCDDIDNIISASQDHTTTVVGTKEICDKSQCQCDTRPTKSFDHSTAVRRDLNIDVLFLVETWHDADSVSFCRLRADGIQVVVRPRPCLRADTLSTNHGGVAAVAISGVQLPRLDVGVNCTSCELLSVCVAAGTSSCVAVVVYRTGPVTSAFFNEYSDVLDRVVTYADPIYVVGDVNIRLDRT